MVAMYYASVPLPRHKWHVWCQYVRTLVSIDVSMKYVLWSLAVNYFVLVILRCVVSGSSEFNEGLIMLVVVVVDPTPPTCCQQSPAPESCGSQQSLPPGGKERLHFVGIRPEVQARKGGW